MKPRVISFDPVAREAEGHIAGAVAAGKRGVADRNAEEMLIASIAMCDVRLDSVIDVLPSAEAFAYPNTRAWYAAALELHEEGTDIDLGRMAAKLASSQDKGRTSELMASYANEMVTTYGRVRALTSLTARTRAAIVRDCWIKRRIGHAAIEIQARAYEYETPVAELEERLQTAQQTVADATRSSSATIGGKELAIEAAKAMKGPKQGLSLGLPRLTKILCGLHRQDTTVIAARTHVGKSTLALQISLWCAKRGHGVSYASLEMPPTLVAPKMASHLAQVNSRYAFGHPLDAGEANRLVQAIDQLHKLPIKLHPDQFATLNDLSRVAKQHATEFRIENKRLELLVLDHVHLVQPGPLSDRPRVDQVAAVSRWTKNIAEKLDMHVIVVAQLSGEASKAAGDKLPKPSQIAECSRIQNDAGNILLVHRPRNADDSFDTTKPASIIVAKNRATGEHGVIEVSANLACQTFTELEPMDTRW